MKAITICQPYPYLICLPRTDPRHKRVENRNWSTRYRGEIAIHAGKSTAWLGGYDLEPGEGANLVYGAIVAVASLVACLHKRQIDRLRPEDPLAWLRTHEHASGPWCWVLQSVQVLRSPQGCPGHQGIWEVQPLLPLDLIPVDGENIR